MRFMSMPRKSPFAKRNGKILKATDINLVTDEVLKEQLEYGKDLISYCQIFRPNGSVKKISNGMNCSNCHQMQEQNLGVIITVQCFLHIQK
jgi:thiosulfate dehydrogenase